MVQQKTHTPSGRNSRGTYKDCPPFATAKSQKNATKWVFK